MPNALRKLPPGSRVSTADFNALVDAVARLRVVGAGVNAGTQLEMHRSAIGTLLSPAGGAKFELLELAEPLEAFDDAKDAGRMTFRADEEDDKWQPAGGADRRVADAQGGAYLAGERRLCYFHPAAGRFVPVDAFQWHLGMLDEDLEAGGSATVSLWQLFDVGPSDSGLDVTAHDWLLDDGQMLAAGSRVIVQLLAHSRMWIVTQAGGCPLDVE